ncbi:MAG TPA: hypothetical protein VF753_12460 [Terriglobales bacterium]
MVLRFLAVLFLSLTLAVGSLAQTSTPVPSQKNLKTWLTNADPRMVAWGAYDAAAMHDRPSIPDLLTLAANWQGISTRDADGNPVPLSQQQKDQRDATAAVVDALIQLHADAPPDTLRVLAPNFGNEVAIMLSRMSAADAQPLALDFYHSSKPAALQLVAAGLLALKPPSGFAADMLSNTTVRAAVYVLNPGMERSYGGSGGSCFTENAPPHDGWPPIGQYVLSTDKTNGNFIVVAGIEPVYARRDESTHYFGDSCLSSFGVHLGSDERLHLIAEMLGVDPFSIPWNTAPETSIVFQSPEQYERTLLVFVHGEQEKYRATAMALAERGLLTPSEAEDLEALPKLQLQINDARKDPSPLPELASLPPRVEAHGPIF